MGSSDSTVSTDGGAVSTPSTASTQGEGVFPTLPTLHPWGCF